MNVLETTLRLADLPEDKFLKQRLADMLSLLPQNMVKKYEQCKKDYIVLCCSCNEVHTIGTYYNVETEQTTGICALCIEDRKNFLELT